MRDSIYARDDQTLAATKAASQVRDDVMGKEEFESLAAFRYAIRRFRRFGESVARAEGLTPQQHELLLAIKGFPGEERPSVTDLAERLQMRTQSMVGLLDRVESLGLLTRIRDEADRRRVWIALTDAGHAKLHRLATLHRDELRSIRAALLDSRE